VNCVFFRPRHLSKKSDSRRYDLQYSISQGILKILIGWLERHRPDDLEADEATNEAAFGGGTGEGAEFDFGASGEAWSRSGLTSHQRNLERICT
jgi:hypothetical protein